MCVLLLVSVCLQWLSILFLLFFSVDSLMVVSTNPRSHYDQPSDTGYKILGKRLKVEFKKGEDRARDARHVNHNFASGIGVARCWSSGRKVYLIMACTVQMACLCNCIVVSHWGLCVCSCLSFMRYLAFFLGVLMQLS